MQNKQIYEENRFGEMKIDIDPMIVRLDFKDIDFLYYLNAKYAKEIQPILDEVFAVPEASNDQKDDTGKSGGKEFDKDKSQVNDMFQMNNKSRNHSPALTPDKKKEVEDKGSPLIQKSKPNPLEMIDEDKDL